MSWGFKEISLASCAGVSKDISSTKIRCAAFSVASSLPCATFTLSLRVGGTIRTFARASEVESFVEGGGGLDAHGTVARCEGNKVELEVLAWSSMAFGRSTPPHCPQNMFCISMSVHTHPWYENVLSAVGSPQSSQKFPTHRTELHIKQIHS